MQCHVLVRHGFGEHALVWTVGRSALGQISCVQHRRSRARPRPGPAPGMTWRAHGRFDHVSAEGTIATIWRRPHAELLQPELAYATGADGLLAPGLPAYPGGLDATLEIDPAWLAGRAPRTELRLYLGPCGHAPVLSWPAEVLALWQIPDRAPWISVLLVDTGGDAA